MSSNWVCSVDVDCRGNGDAFGLISCQLIDVAEGANGWAVTIVDLARL